MLMVGRIEPAFGRVSVAESPADQHQGGTGDAGLFYLITDVGESAADQAFVRPADPVGNDRRTLCAVMWSQRAHDPGEVVDRQMDCQGRATRAEVFERLA